MKFDRLVESILNKTVDNNDVLKDLVDSYIDNDYTLDQGYGEEMAKAKAEQPIVARKILKLKGQEFLDIIEELASAETYASEYAGPSESSEVQATIHRCKEELQAKFGFSY